MLLEEDQNTIISVNVASVHIIFLNLGTRQWLHLKAIYYQNASFSECWNFRMQKMWCQVDPSLTPLTPMRTPWRAVQHAGYVAINVTLILQGPPRAVWALPHTSPLVMLPLIEGGERLATPGPERGEMRSHIRLSAAWTPSVMSKYQRWTWGRQGQEPSWYASTSCVWSDYSCLLPQSRIHHRWTSSAAQVVGRHLQLRNQQSWEGELAWKSHTSFQAEGWAPPHHTGNKFKQYTSLIWNLQSTEEHQQHDESLEEKLLRQVKWPECQMLKMWTTASKTLLHFDFDFQHKPYSTWNITRMAYFITFIQVHQTLWQLT